MVVLKNVDWFFVIDEVLSIVMYSLGCALLGLFGVSLYLLAVPPPVNISNTASNFVAYGMATLGLSYGVGRIVTKIVLSAAKSIINSIRGGHGQALDATTAQ